MVARSSAQQVAALQQEAALLETYEAASIAAMGALERAYDVTAGKTGKKSLSIISPIPDTKRQVYSETRCKSHFFIL